MAQIENENAIDVFDQLEIDLSSIYNIAKYMRSTQVWDRLVKQVRDLDVWRGVALQLSGRLDIASYTAYEDSRLDWILAVYNNIKSTCALTVGTIIDCPLKEQVDLVLAAATAEGTVTGRIGFTRL